jgi:transposase
MAGAGQRASRQLCREELEGRIAEQDAVIAVLRGQSAEQRAMIVELKAEIVELQARLDQNSRNSSKPPSSDGYCKPSPKERSLRERSGRGPGGRHGHEGSHLERVEVPDRVIVHEPGVCEDCGRDLADAEEVEGGGVPPGVRYP